MDAPGIALEGGGGALRWGVFRGSQQIAAGQAAGANLQLLGMEAYRQRLTEALRQALTAGGIASAELRRLGLGLSGVDRKPELDALYAWIHEAWPQVTHAWVGNDALPALRAGAGALQGVLLIAGTGSICFGCGPDAGGKPQRVRVGGWGTLLGDEGAGYWFGLQLLRAACRCADGRDRDAALLERVLAHFGLEAPQALIPHLNGMTTAEQRLAIAQLAPLVAELAREGDSMAVGLLEQGARELAEQAIICTRRLQDVRPFSKEEIPVVAHGAVLVGWGELRAKIAERLHVAHPAQPFHMSGGSVLAGALQLADEFPWQMI